MSTKYLVVERDDTSGEFYVEDAAVNGHIHQTEADANAIAREWSKAGPVKVFKIVECSHFRKRPG